MCLSWPSLVGSLAPPPTTVDAVLSVA
jgi:hypothetical protein